MIEITYLQDRWPLQDHYEIRDYLLSRYRESHRHYHTMDHLADVLDKLALLEGGGEYFSGRVTLLAAWFHDAIYDPESDSNEEDSAELARIMLRDVIPDGDVDEVVRLIELTKTHNPTIHDHNGRALCDADLAVLGSDVYTYFRYASAVRMEYIGADYEDFLRGRFTVIESFRNALVFNTDYACKTWAHNAQTNIHHELSWINTTLENLENR